MAAEAVQTRFQASVIRYVLDHGGTPDTAADLDYQEPARSAFHITLNNNLINAGRDYFIPPLLAAYLAGAILDYTPEA